MFLNFGIVVSYHHIIIHNHGLAQSEYIPHYDYQLKSCMWVHYNYHVRLVCKSFTDVITNTLSLSRHLGHLRPHNSGCTLFKLLSPPRTSTAIIAIKPVLPIILFLLPGGVLGMFPYMDSTAWVEHLSVAASSNSSHKWSSPSSTDHRLTSSTRIVDCVEYYKKTIQI